MHAPVCPKHPLDILPGGQVRFFYLNDEVKHRKTLAICSVLLSQGGSHQLSTHETFFDAIRQGNDGIYYAPAPDARLVWIPESKPCYPRIQIQSQTICLAFCAAIVACVGEHPD